MNNSVSERIKNIIVTLMANDIVGESMTLTDIAEKFSLSLPCVRNDLLVLSKICNKAQYGMWIEVNGLDLDEYCDDNIEAAILDGDLDDEVISVNLYAANDIAYMNMEYEEYDALAKLSQKLGNKKALGKKVEKEIYKICKDTNDYAETNKIVHATIVEAIENKEGIKFLFLNSKINKYEEIAIFPIKIVEYESFGKSYVVTQVDGKNESYRLDKIKNIESIKLAPIKIDEQELKKLDYVWDMDFNGEFTTKFKVFNDNGGRVIEKIKRDLAQYIEQADYKIETCDEAGNIMVEGKVIGKYAFERFVRSYGASIVVFEPQEIVNDIIDSNIKKKKMYER